MVSPAPISTAPASIAQAAETVSTQITDAVDGIIRAGQDQVARQLEYTLAQSRRHLDQSSNLATKSFEDLAGVARQNLDAVLTINQAVTSGLALFWREIATFNRSALERGLDAGTRLLDVRSLQEVVAIQAEYAKASVDDLVKFSELAAKAADQAAVPLNQNVRLSSIRWAKPLAA